MDRRRFVKVASAGVAGVAAARPAHGAHWRWPADDIRAGVIGVGSRGQSVMRTFLRVPGVRITALCDVLPARLAQGRRITAAETPGYTEYRSMLDQKAKELDVVLVATPLRFHADHVAAALDSGQHVFGEKLMAYDLDGCRRIVEARRRTGRIYQVGHQYRYAAWTREAIRRVKAGEIGDVTHIFAYWHRNNDWRRPVPQEPVPGFSATELERLVNWRLYREYSRGLLAELGSHQLDLANWIFDAVPEAVVGTGAVTTYHDGRETFDNVQATFEYPRGRRFIFSSMLNNHKLGYQLAILGTGGTLELTLDDATFYYEPARPNSAVPKDRPAVADSVVEKGVPTGPSLSTRGDMPYRGTGKRVEVAETASADLLAVTDFIEGVRLGRRPMADERVALGSAVPIIFADDATRSGGRVEFARELAALRALAE
jgi:predicted dehydrogenase